MFVNLDIHDSKLSSNELRDAISVGMQLNLTVVEITQCIMNYRVMCKVRDVARLSEPPEQYIPDISLPQIMAAHAEIAGSLGDTIRNITKKGISGSDINNYLTSIRDTEGENL